MNLSGKTVLLTGATGGIGSELVYALARREAKLIIAGRNQQALDSLIADLPGEHMAIVADLNSAQDRQAIVDSLIETNISVDVLINNAGVSGFGLFGETSDEQIAHIIQSNLIAPILLARNLLAVMNPADSVICNIGSAFGSIGYPGFTGYCASKFGIRGFSEALSRELSDSNIRVQHIAPRATETRINSGAVLQMNRELGNRTDSPVWVAEQICLAIEAQDLRRNLGWPEKLIIPFNDLFKSVFDRLISHKLPTIKRFAQEK